MLRRFNLACRPYSMRVAIRSSWESAVPGEGLNRGNETAIADVLPGCEMSGARPRGIPHLVGTRTTLAAPSAFQRRFFANTTDPKCPLKALEAELNRMRNVLERRETQLAVHYTKLAELEADRKALRKRVAAMSAVLYDERVPEGSEDFVKTFAAKARQVQMQELESAEADIRAKEAVIRTKEAEIRAKEAVIRTKEADIRRKKSQIVTGEAALISELRGERPAIRKILKLTESEDCNRKFLGRKKEMDRALVELYQGGEPKEKQSPVIVYSAPRQGKSRVMDEVAKRGMATLGDGKLFVVVLSYNGTTPTRGNADGQLEGFASRFFCRMLLASVGVYDVVSADQMSKRYPLLKQITANDFDRILRQVHDLSNQRIWLLADEFSKCYLQAAGEPALQNQIFPSLKSEITAIYAFMELHPPLRGNKIMLSGFTESARTLLQSATGRMVIGVELPLIHVGMRESYRPMKNTLTKLYRRGGFSFPTMIYEIMKSCVGMLGLWIELCVIHHTYPQTLHDFPVPWLKVLAATAKVFFPIVEKYLQTWGDGSLDLARLVEEEAKTFASTDVGASMLFLPLSGRSIAHPIPFFHLVLHEGNALFQSRSLGWHLLVVYDEIQRFGVGMKTASPEERQATNAKRGKLVENLTCRILRMRFHALALRNEPRELHSWLNGWIQAPPGAQSISSVTILPPKTPPPIEKDPRRSALKTMFDGTVLKEPGVLTAEAMQILEELSDHGGVLLAPESNPGFDVVAVLRATRDGKQGIVLLLVETKCTTDPLLASDMRQRYSIEPSEVHEAESSVQTAEASARSQRGRTKGRGKPNLSEADKDAINLSATRKAWLTLSGVNTVLPHFNSVGQPVLHVCYVHVTTGNFEVNFQTGPHTLVNRVVSQPRVNLDLGGTIGTMSEQGTTVSLHVVAGQAAMEDFLTAAVYHAIPDAEWSEPTEETTEL